MFLKDVSVDGAWQALYGSQANYQRITLPGLCVDVVKDVFIHNLGVLDNDQFEEVNGVFKKVFFTFKEFEPFYRKFSLFRVGDGYTASIVYPNALASQSFGAQQFERFESLYFTKKWSPIFIDCSLRTNVANYEYANKQFVFVKEQEHARFKGHKFTFFNVVLPDPMADLVQLDEVNGLKVRGRAGWIPGTFLSSHQSSNPFLHFRCVNGELHNFTFGATQKQLINGLMQWAPKPLVSITVPVPQHQPIFSEKDFSIRRLSPEEIMHINEAESMLNQHVMFKTSECWEHCRIMKFGGKKWPFQIRFDDEMVLNIRFDPQLHTESPSAESPTSSWFVVVEMVHPPVGFSAVEQCPPQDAIDNGFLEGWNVMFKFEQGWFVGKVNAVINRKKRTSLIRPQQYVVEWTDKTKTSVWFRAEKWSREYESPVSSWVLLQPL